MYHPLTRLTAAAAMVAALAACSEESETGMASGPEPAEIAERQDNFESIGDSFKAIRAQLETDSPDLARIETAALDINQRAGNIENHFPTGSGREDGFDTEALATIWERPGDFAAAHDKLIEESEELARLAAAGDPAAVGAQVGPLGNSCKDCHDIFRLDDD
ncbi:MAG: cytochrome c [Erythrobacter sp.]|uniref:c-type cytochrome n=1 Tax=Erythrobacter sp. TaxID=1042 RepID=UPI003C775AA8